MVNLIRRLVGDPNERALKEFWPVVTATTALADRLAALDDAGLRAHTDALRTRLQSGEELADLLPEAMAAAREAIARATGERAYDVQLLGALALHKGSVAEMKTGE